MNIPDTQEVTCTREQLKPAIIVREKDRVIAFTGRRGGWWQFDKVRDVWVKLQGDPHAR